MGPRLLDRGIRRLRILQRIDVGDGRKRRDRLLLVSFDFLRLLVEIQTDDAPGNDQQDEQCRNNKQCIAKLVRTGGVSARMLRH